MATKVINTILNLRDNMSGGLLKVVRNTKGVSTEMKSATREVLAFKNKTASAVSGIVSKMAGLAGAVGLPVSAALAAKTGLSEAMDLEGYKLQLETATKSTQKASKIMSYAINLANKTPFEGGQLVEGAAKFEAMGMSATTWLSRAGDMAAATNKDFDSATEALIDAQSGELERLKEFGITKAGILQQGAKMYRGVEIVNNKGQIVDQEKFNNAMLALMENRFKGGMEKQATTLKGTWSTVTGITKSALAGIVGISSDGSIKSGSAMEFLKNKASLLANRLQKMQQDGTLDRLALKFNQGLAKAISFAGNAFVFFKQHSSTIIQVLKTLGIAFAIVKVAKFANGVMQGVKTVSLFARTVGLVVAANPVVLLIAAIIVAGALLIANWSKVKAFASHLWINIKKTFTGIKESIVTSFNSAKDGIQSAFSGIKDGILGAFSKAKDGVKSFFSWIGDKLSWLNDKVESIPVIGSAYKGIKSAGSSVISALQGNALGTSYFSGGLTRVNERGGEIMNLPNGTQIIPHDVSKQMGGSGVVVNVTIQGNVLGNEAYANEVGGIVAQRVLRAIENT